MKSKTKKHGGRRNGAGRPAADTVRFECRVKPATAAAIDAKATAPKTRGQVLDELVDR